MQLRLRTEISVRPQPGLLSREEPVALLGSCFSDNIGKRLVERGFSVVFNPLGSVYNAEAMRRQAELIASGREVEESELFEHQGLWRHFLSHTLTAHPDRSTVASNINAALERARQGLGPDMLLCLTLGTAFLYELADSGEVVANCHKLPSGLFRRRLMGVDEVTSSIQEAIRLLRPRHTILTVSPIRHLADGLDGNSLSKATLRLAADAVAMSSADTVTYFPAFEALTDDLRDYRFYSADMTHPTEQAADYIYDLFEEAYADLTTRQQAAMALKERRRAAHRPLITIS